MPWTDPFEEHDLAAQNPSIVAKLLDVLQAYNRTHCNGQPCLPDQATSKRARGTPTTINGVKVWVPWDGDPTPSVCDTNRSRGAPAPPGGGGEIGSFDHIDGLGSTICHASGWTSGPVSLPLVLQLVPCPCPLVCGGCGVPHTVICHRMYGVYALRSARASPARAFSVS